MRFLGKKPPEQRSFKGQHWKKGWKKLKWEKHFLDDDKRTKHFRSALLEAADFVDRLRFEVFEGKVPEGDIKFLKELIEMLRVSAGEVEK